MRVALLSYRSDPSSGGQRVYVRNLSRELVRLGHEVEVFSGQPYPQLDDGVVLARVRSLDPYRQPDPFRTPRRGEFGIGSTSWSTRSWPGPVPGVAHVHLRAARLMRRRAREFDVIHDNQTLGYGLLSIQRLGAPLVETIQHPITVDRRVDLAAAASAARRRSLRRWVRGERVGDRPGHGDDPLGGVAEHCGVAVGPAGGVGDRVVSAVEPRVGAHQVYVDSS
jgi:hypothetical protein